MEYLKIQNKGTLPLKLLALIGASTKTNDLSKIGEFGTGLKYAIAYFLRHKIDIKLFIGVHEVKINLRENKIGENTYDEICINKKATGITTQYGFQWKAWEALREVWCNAMDEKNPTREVVEDQSNDVEDSTRAKYDNIRGLRGHTTFYIQCTSEVAKVLNKWSDYFINEEPLFENENFAIYSNNNDKLKLYKNGVLVHTSDWYKSLFRYDIKKCHLNELREYKGFMQADVATALLNSNKKVASILLDQYSEVNIAKTKNFVFGLLETRLDYSTAIGTNTEKLKEIFEGYLFLNPDSSTKAQSARAVKVNREFFNVLKAHNMPTEDIRYASGGYYGGNSGYSGYTTDDVPYRPVTNQSLKQNILRILAKHGIEGFNFIVGIPVSKSFDFIVKDRGSKEYVIATDLEKLNDKDLEVIVLLMILDWREESTYQIMKRLLKLH